MPFEELFFQYGALGGIVVYFIYDKVKLQKNLDILINNNTIAMTKVYEVMNNCKNKNLKR